MKGEYQFCPGLDPSEYETMYFSKIKYDMKNVRRMNYPVERIDSCNCLLIVSQASQQCKYDGECVSCSACNRLVSDLNERL
jgi:hypothetical protein